MNNRSPITKSRIDNDTTFLDLRGTLFRELTEDVIVEIADLHVISTETILKKPLMVNEDHEIKNESDSKNRERLLSIYENAPSCCDKKSV